MSDTPIQGIMDTTMEKIRALANANTIVGEAIQMGDDATVVPISKLSYGFASGGTDWPGKSPDPKPFGGGGGAGISITPVAFLVMQRGEVRMLPVAGEGSAVERAVTMAPEIIDKITDIIKKLKDKKKDKDEESDAPEEAQG
jgi:sporulation protein YtfJ